MKRREALTSITLSTGLVISAGTWAGLLQSCTAEEVLGWVPQFLNKSEAKTVSALADIIIPKGNDIGALDVQVPKLIDLFLSGVSSDKDADKFKQGLAFFEQANEKKQGKKFFSFNKKTKDKVLAGYFKITPTETEQVLAMLWQEEPEDSPEAFYIYSFLTTLRELTIHAYRGSEKIGEEVLSYDPVPGGYQGCIQRGDVGNAWSL